MLRPARPLALVLATAVVLASDGCATARFTEDVTLAPEPGRAGLVVRVFETGGDAKAGRLSTRDTTSVLENDDGVVYEARGAEWALGDADPGAYRLTVTWGRLPGSPNGGVLNREIRLVEGRTLAVDVKTERPSWALVGVLLVAAAALAAVVVVGCAKDPSGCGSRRPTEPLPAGVARHPVPGAGEAAP